MINGWKANTIVKKHEKYCDKHNSKDNKRCKEKERKNENKGKKCNKI